MDSGKWHLMLRSRGAGSVPPKGQEAEQQPRLSLDLSPEPAEAASFIFVSLCVCPHHPVGCTASTKLALSSSTIQAASETRHSQYSTCTTIKHNPASIRKEAQPVLNLYYHQAQSSQHPKGGTASIRNEALGSIRNEPVRNEALPVLMLYYVQIKKLCCEEKKKEP